MPPAAREMPGSLKARVRAALAAWAHRRQGDDRLPVTIATRRVYILPTRAGAAFATLVFVMLVAGLNYTNSIALLITFLMAGFGMIAMHLTHRNLVGVSLNAVACVDAFVGEHGRLLLTLENAADTARLALDCEVAGSARVAIDLPPRSAARADLSVALERRGRLTLDRIRLSTAFPFGLFRAWTYVHLRTDGARVAGTTGPSRSAAGARQRRQRAGRASRGR